MSIDLGNFFAHYAKSYETFDARQVAQLVASPCLFMLKGEVQVLRSDAEVAAFLTKGLENYRNNGCEVFGAEVLDARMLGPHFCEADIAWTLMSADRDVVMEFQSTYILAVFSGSWKITTIIRHDRA